MLKKTLKPPPSWHSLKLVLSPKDVGILEDRQVDPGLGLY